MAQSRKTLVSIDPNFTKLPFGTCAIYFDDLGQDTAKILQAFDLGLFRVKHPGKMGAELVKVKWYNLDLPPTQ